jgi:hypothetical protein
MCSCLFVAINSILFSNGRAFRSILIHYYYLSCFVCIFQSKNPRDYFDPVQLRRKQCSSTLIDEEIFIADDFNCQYQWRTLSASSLLSSASLSSLSSSSSSGRIHISCRPYYYYTCEHIQAFKVIRIRRQKLTCRLMSIIVNERISFEKSIELN